MVYSFVLWVPTPFFSWANIIESVIGSKVNGPIKSQPKAQKREAIFWSTMKQIGPNGPIAWKKSLGNNIGKIMFFESTFLVFCTFTHSIGNWIKNCTTWSVTQRYLLPYKKTKNISKLIEVTYKYVCVKVRLFMEYWTIFQRSLLSTYNKMRLTKQKTLCLSWGRKEKGACTLLHNPNFYGLLTKIPIS